MPSTTANGITIEFERSGDPADPAVLLIMGLGGQLVAWDPEFVSTLVARQFHVICFDNRDTGLSTWFDVAGAPDLAAAVTAGSLPPPAYLLSDMADDAAGLLDALAIPAAHLVGVSMGGMVAQEMAINHAGRVRSLVSIMSTTGNPAVGQPRRDALEMLLQPPAADREEAIDAAVKAASVIASPAFPRDEARDRRRAAASYDRAWHPAGSARHMVAIASSPDRTAALRSVRAPTLVVHGDADPLVDPSGGRATAEAVPSSELWMVPGMGHELPPALFDELADRIVGNVRRA